MSHPGASPNIFLDLLGQCSFEYIEPAVFSSGFSATEPSRVAGENMALFLLDLTDHPLDSIPEGHVRGRNADLLRFSNLYPSAQLDCPVLVLPHIMMINPESLCLVVWWEGIRKCLGVTELRKASPNTKILGFIP